MMLKPSLCFSKFRLLRLLKIITILSILAFVSGCAHQVRFEGLKEIKDSSGVPRYRRASDYGLIDGAPMVESYLVTASDMLEFRRVDGKDGEVTLEVGDCSLCSCKNTDLKIGTALVNASPRPRISGFILDTAQAVRVKAGQKDGPANICAKPVLGQTWAKLHKKLEANTGVKVSLLPNPQRRAFPGDSIRITIEYRIQAAQNRGPQPFTLVETVSNVDSAGRAYIPALSLAAPAAPEKEPKPVYRLVQQDGAGAALRVQLWRSGQAFNDQTTLDDVERCLAGQWPADTTESLDGLVEKCRQLGINATTYGHTDKDNKYVRYKLDVEQRWVLVLWDGRRIDNLFIPGQSVDAAVREAFRNSVGHNLAEGEKVFATVDPRRELRTQGDTPFYARIDNTSTSLRNVLLAPGDVVHMSYFKPCILEPSSGE
jgi:hypothetical protein